MTETPLNATYRAMCSCGDEPDAELREDVLVWADEHLSMHESLDPDERERSVRITRNAYD